MLEIIRRGFSADLRSEMTERVKECISLGERAFLIVPEQQTVTSEVEMAKRLPPSSVLHFEVTNFTRFSNTVFRSLGGLYGEYCDKTRESLIMWRTLTELSPLLELTAKRRDVGVGIVGRALAAIKELESLSLNGEDLARSLESEELAAKPRLFAKLSDLAKIYSLYKSLLSEKYLDSQDMLDAACKRLWEREDFLSGATVIIEGFTSFTEGQYAIIAALAKRCKVFVYLISSAINERGFEYGEITRAEEKLGRTVRAHGGDIKLKSRLLEDAKNNSRIINIAESLWLTDDENVKYSLQNDDEIRIFEAHTPFDEADFVASDIKRRVFGGARYSDFAVIARDSKTYEGIIDYSMHRQGIPTFTSTGRDLSSYEIIKLIYTAYNILLFGFKREEILTYAKCSLSGITREECDELEIYVNTWQISEGRFCDGMPWNMNPDGYSTRRAPDADERLLRINGAREKLVSPLLRFADEADAAETVRAQATALVNFLRDMRLEHALSERVSALRAAGENELAEEEESLWGLITDTLDLIVEISGNLPADKDGFLSQLKVAFSTREFGKIPVFRDVVTIGSADMLRLFDKKHIYLIGVLEDAFPKSVSESSYFTDKDKAVLCTLGLEIEPDTDVKAGRELYIFTRALSFARESVTLTYPSHSTVFKLTPRSSVISKILSLADGLSVKRCDGLLAEDLIYSPEYALESGLSERAEIRAALSDAGFSHMLEISEGELKASEMKISEDAAHEIYCGTLRLSQSAIDRYISCPLSHFLQYTLRLSEERRAELDARNIGTLIHAILENYFGTLEKRGVKANELSPEELLALVEESAREYVKQIGEDDIDSPRTRVKIERLKTAALPIVKALSDELSESRFTPKFFELSLGRGKPNTPDAITYKEKDGDILVYGIVDRVDTYEAAGGVAVRVIDYKTGSKEFSPTDMEEGKNLQMFLYLKAICDSKNEGFRRLLGVKEGGKIIPAGVIYVKTSLSDVTVDTPSKEEALSAVSNMQKREGMVLDDNETLSAMGLKYTPVYDQKKPTEIPSGKRHLLYDEEGWEKIMDTIEGKIREVVSNMRGGDISANPKIPKGAQKTPCEYCIYKAICRNVRTK